MTHIERNVGVIVITAISYTHYSEVKPPYRFEARFHHGDKTILGIGRDAEGAVLDVLDKQNKQRQQSVSNDLAQTA